VGRDWFCKWDHSPRTLKSGERDCEDAEFHLRGKCGTMVIDGQGIARVSGETPRLYVYDQTQKWQNVEVTFYARRVEEFQQKDSQGFVVGARSEHQDAGREPCQARTYYGRLLYIGLANFQKELWHDEHHLPGATELIYTPVRPVDNFVPWNPPDPEIPCGEWVGVKYIVRNLPDDQGVRLELFRDRTGWDREAFWECVASLDDIGDWTKKAPCEHPEDQVFKDPATSVFLRNDYLVAADYARFSIREIAPL
jgi:hypothetical protein